MMCRVPSACYTCSHLGSTFSTTFADPACKDCYDENASGDTPIFKHYEPKKQPTDTTDAS